MFVKKVYIRIYLQSSIKTRIIVVLKIVFFFPQKKVPLYCQESSVAAVEHRVKRLKHFQHNFRLVNGLIQRLYILLMLGRKHLITM